MAGVRSDEPARALSGQQVLALKFAAHRQLARWANKPKLSERQQGQRLALKGRFGRLRATRSRMDASCGRLTWRGMAVADGWRKIERGLFESADGQWRICNPWKLTTELRHRWLVAERRASGSGWCMHDGDHATLQDARAYVEAHEPGA
jgi:hypothetical protein